jgi:glycosyltransferase involved in cell wall biosynthesis
MTVDPEAPYFSVVMPAFNEERNVCTAIPTLIREFDQAGCSYEIIVIDDGSVDGTADAVRSLRATNSSIRLYSHRRNMGPGSGVYTGIAVARGTFVIFVPADLAMNPGELRKYIDASRDADVVNGLRSDRRDYGLFRKCMSIANIGLIRLLFGMRLRQYNYIQAYRRAMFDRFYPRSMGVFITAEILVLARDAGFRTIEVEIEYLPRLIGTTGVVNWRSIRKTLVELAAFWIRWMRQRIAGGEPFDAAIYKRDDVMPLIVEDRPTSGAI